MADSSGPSSSKRPLSPSTVKQPAEKRSCLIPPLSWDILVIWPKGHGGADSGMSPVEHHDAGWEYIETALIVKGVLI